MVCSFSRASPSGLSSGRLGKPNYTFHRQFRAEVNTYYVFTSFAVTRRLSQSMREITLRMNSGWKSNSCISNSASWKWRGKDAGEVLHSLTAQVTKLAVMTFMVSGQVHRGLFNQINFDVTDLRERKNFPREYQVILSITPFPPHHVYTDMKLMVFLLI